MRPSPAHWLFRVPLAVDRLIQQGLSNNPRARPQSVVDYARLVSDGTRVAAAASVAGQPWLQTLQTLEKTDLKPLIDGFRTTTENLRKTTIESLRPKMHGQPLAVATQTSSPVPAATAATPAPIAAPPTGSMNIWSWFVYSLAKRYADGRGRARVRVRPAPSGIGPPGRTTAQ